MGIDLLIERDEDDEMSELMLDLLERRVLVGDSSKRSRSGGMFSLFPCESTSSVVVRDRFAFGVASGVKMAVADLNETIDGDRDSDALPRFPSTVVVWERVTRLVDEGGVMVSVDNATASIAIVKDGGENVAIVDSTVEGRGRCCARFIRTDRGRPNARRVRHVRNYHSRERHTSTRFLRHCSCIFASNRVNILLISIYASVSC